VPDTINYGAGYEIHGVLTNSFDVYATFVVTEAGNWDTGSLTQKSKFVLANDNGDQPISVNLAFVEMNSNAVETIIASNDTYQPADFSSVVMSGASARFTLIDAVTGKVRYDGLPPFNGAFTAVVNALKSGATQNYRYAVSINGAIPVFTAIGATAISSVTDSSGIARFNHAGTDPFVTQLITISGFTTNTAYNITGEVTVTGAGFFEVSSITFGTDETGSFLSNVSSFEPLEVKTTKEPITIIQPITLFPGDEVQIMQSCEGASDNITNTDARIEMLGM